MKIKSIRQVLKKYPHITLLTCKDGVQWVSAGVVAYPLIGCPEYDEQTLLSFFDENNDDKYSIVCADNEETKKFINLLYEGLEGNEIEPSDLSISFRGDTEYLVLFGELGVTFVKKVFLKPFKDLNYITFSKRGNLVIVREGFDVRAIIGAAVLNDDIIREIENLYHQVRCVASGVSDNDTAE